jgi:hypothetical protein
MNVSIKLKDQKMNTVLSYFKVLQPNSTIQDLKNILEKIGLDEIQRYCKGLRQQALQIQEKSSFEDLEDILDV